jgi:biopolymer transport protein ExbD
VSKLRKRRKASIIVPVVSMGDIAFLLIIFFLLCSHFAEEAGLKVTPARSEDIDDLPRARILVAIDAGGTLYYRGSAISGPDELEGCLHGAITDDTPPGARRVQLKVDESVGPEVYKPVLKALAESGATIEFVGEKGPRRDE